MGFAGTVFMSGLVKSEFAQDTVHNPVGRCGADTVASTIGFAVKVVNHSLNQRKLYVLGVGDVKLMASLAVMQGYGLEGEHRETDHALAANNLNAVFLG